MLDWIPETEKGYRARINNVLQAFVPSHTWRRVGLDFLGQSSRAVEIGFGGEKLLRLRDAAQRVAADRNQPSAHFRAERIGEARGQQQILLD